MRLGKREILVGLVFLFGQLAHADDASAKIYEYFGVFNDKDLEQIANNIYAMPLLVGGGEGHLVWNDAESATNSLRNTYKEIESRGWKASVIDNTKTCTLSANLALVDVKFSRMNGEGKAIPPEIRTTLYVLKKTAEGWRIIAFFGHDSDHRPSC
tara:strand:+ start:102 stop:566 length:465 start_codon:yes stop_codon:yes gene_type:complete